MSIRLSDYDYDLPKGYIAQFPAQKRDGSRFLVIDRARREILHKQFTDIIDFFQPGDTLVLNDTKVLPARIFCRRASGGVVELLLLRKSSPQRYVCLVKPQRVKIGELLSFNTSTVTAALVSRNEVEFNTADTQAVYQLGSMPLPPYIKREADSKDIDRYQTVYARHEGSIAAPTAGLHFTSDVLERFQSRGINVAYVTVHIGLATFKPIISDDVSEHSMGQESYCVPAESLAIIRSTRAKGKRIVAVGTSSTRVLETISLDGETTDACAGETGIFMYPGYRFKTVDSLITNFHMSRTTPFMLVCAFAGKELIFEAYRQAIEKKYRFLSYGDSMVIV